MAAVVVAGGASSPARGRKGGPQSPRQAHDSPKNTTNLDCGLLHDAFSGTKAAQLQKPAAREKGRPPKLRVVCSCGPNSGVPF